MGKLFGPVYILVATVLAGVAITALLSMGRFEAMQLVYAAIGGALVAIPASLYLSRKLAALR